MKPTKINWEMPIYQKHGRRYVELGKYMDFDCYEYGAHLLVVNKGGTSYLRNVEPDKAGALAAMKVAKDAMLQAFMEASDLQPVNPPSTITEEQRRLLDELKATGFNESVWIRESAQGIVDAAFKALEAYNERGTKLNAISGG